MVCNWLGAFPIVYDKRSRLFSTSKCGIFITIVHVTIVGLQVYTHLTMIFYGVIKKTSAVTSIVLSISGIGLLCMLLRRMLFVNDTVKCYNSLSEWSVDISIRRSSIIIMYVSIVAVLIEFVGECIDR